MSKVLVVWLLAICALTGNCFDSASFNFNDGGVGDVQVSGSNDKCALFCSKTYAAHTNENSAAEKSCQQGCRLFSVLQFVDQGSPGGFDSQKINETVVAETCERDCRSAYTDPSLKVACADGCKNQSPFKNGQIEVMMDSSSPLFPYVNKLFSDTVSKFNAVKQNMLQQLTSFGNSQKSDRFWWPFGSISNEEFGQQAIRRAQKLLEPFINELRQNAKPQPVIIGGAEDVASKNPSAPHAEDLSKTSKVFASRPEHVANSEFDGPSVVGNLDENNEPIVIVKLINDLYSNEDFIKNHNIASTRDSFDGKPHEPSPPLIHEVTFIDADDSWLACLARRTQRLSLVTRWMLCVALMMSVLFMVWLCLAIMRTNQGRRRLYMQSSSKADTIYFMPPPAYDKLSEYAMKVDTKQPPSPPPSYEAVTIPEQAKSNSSGGVNMA